MVRAERLGVEQIPELQHDERGEEYREFMYMKVGTARQTVQEQCEQHGKECQAAEHDALGHAACDDKVGALARLLLHHLLRRRQRSQSQCGKGIHYDVNPQYLCNGERHLCSYH